MRFPHTSVSYITADLFSAPDQWRGKFDFVLESYPFQVLPPELRSEAIVCIASFVASGGTLLMIARGREEDEPKGSMPWPLTRAELSQFLGHGTKEMSFEDYLDAKSPPARRFRTTYTRNHPIGRY